jgi:hypothetical protein
MVKVLAALEQALKFIGRYPNLDGSHLLKKESASLASALEKYNSKAEEIELSFLPDYAETQSLIEGEAKKRVTADFIKKFTKKHCSTQLVFEKADKKARMALLLSASKDNKLHQLRQDLDQNQRYREMFQELGESSEGDIKVKILNMAAKDFTGLVVANGLDAIRTKGGAVSSSKLAREKVLKQILRDKMSDELIRGIGTDA